MLTALNLTLKSLINACLYGFPIASQPSFFCEGTLLTTNKVIPGILLFDIVDSPVLTILPAFHGLRGAERDAERLVEIDFIFQKINLVSNVERAIIMSVDSSWKTLDEQGENIPFFQVDVLKMSVLLCVYG